jgi:membrane associated rhomboid family serine protease
MFPIRDNIPSTFTPYAARTIIALNAIVFLYELGLSRKEMVQLFYSFGVVPARYFHPAWAEMVGFPGWDYLPFLTHMFLHSGFLHFIANMWILWVFADNVEDVMGPVRFVCFYFCSGLVALAGHAMFNSGSTVPVVGASGAIAGVMGAYLLLYPRAVVLTLVPIFIIPFFLDLPAVLFLGLWFLLQVFSGLASNIAQQGAAGVAWWAHAFGFLGGMTLLFAFKSDKRLEQTKKRLRRFNDFFFS